MNNINKVTDILWQISDKKELEKFLKVLFSQKEINDFSDRIKILDMLNKGNSQRTVAGELGVSITTVTRGNKIFKDNEKIIKKYIN